MAPLAVPPMCVHDSSAAAVAAAAAVVAAINWMECIILKEGSSSAQERMYMPL